MFVCLGTAIDVRWARFDREKRRDASLLAKDFMVGGVRLQKSAVEETYPRRPPRCGDCQDSKPTVTGLGRDRGTQAEAGEASHDGSGIATRGLRNHGSTRRNWESRE